MRTRLPIALLAAGALLAPAAAQADVTPPPPTGSAAVGLLRTTFTDQHRTEHLAVPSGGPRLIPLRVWYPAARPGRTAGEVFTRAEQDTYESVFGLDAGALNGIDATTTAGARPAAGRHPVLLLSPGWGNSAGFHDAQATDLASHGYVVVGIDHPGDTTAVDVGGGRILAMNAAGEAIQDDSAVERIADVRYVLHHLGAVRGAGELDQGRIGAYGHSMGARATAGAMYFEPSIRAGVNLDGLAVEPVLSGGLDQPYGYANGVHPGGGDAVLGRLIAELRSHLRGPHPLRNFPTTEHAGFSDNVWLVPQLGLDPEGQELGTVTPAAAVRGQRHFLRRFFDRYL